MALISCPDCGGIVSEGAPSCPHCGKPIVRARAESAGSVTTLEPIGDESDSTPLTEALPLRERGLPGRAATLSAFAVASAVTIGIAFLFPQSAPEPRSSDQNLSDHLFGVLVKSVLLQSKD